MFTIAPFVSASFASAARHIRNVPFTLTSKSRSQRSSGKLASPSKWTTPALLTSRSSEPSSRTVRSTAAAVCSALRTSHASASAWTPRASTSFAASSSSALPDSS
jgi:hypothetical protein